MQRRVWTVKMEDTVDEVRTLFERERLSWAPVTTEAGLVVGVLSATDLLRHLADGQDASPQKAWQLCTYKPIVIAPDATLKELARLMIDRGIHHVVVMDATLIVGVVSSLDFVRTFIAD
jgi:CBS domain-containing protein